MVVLLATVITADLPVPSDRQLVEALRLGNYRADREATEKLLMEFRAVAASPDRPDRWFALYQAGTASSLLAGFVGPGSLANPAGDVPAMIRYLEEAAAAFEATIAAAPKFADAHAALANNLGYRAVLTSDAGTRSELAARAEQARARSLALGPRNPRVVAGHAGQLFWAPAGARDRTRGIERYREALLLFAAESPADRSLHAWGEPDVWAFLAMAHLMSDPPQPLAAKIAIDAALAERPDFAWARQGLLPRVEQALVRAGLARLAPQPF
jgi:tetratricopeptide (TPR) repeat protein